MFSLIEVKTGSEKKEFLLLPVKLYKRDPHWIRPLDADLNHVFDPHKNKMYRNGECIRWILRDEQGDVVGRVAAFVDHKSLKNEELRAGGMGFFECIDRQEPAFMLFDACKQWLTDRGMEAMDGPINFGDRDRWWGCLADGFHDPVYGMPYNFPYYKELFEAYGFKNYFNQYTYRSLVTIEGVRPEIMEKAERIFRNPEYSVKRLEKSKADKYAADFVEIYNKAWAVFPGVEPMTFDHAKNLFRELKPVMDEKLMMFIYYNDQPISFFLLMPDINQIFKHLNGKLDLIGKLKFAYYLWKGTCKRAISLVIGTIPEFQGKGMEGAIVMSFADVALKKNFPYTELQFNWIGDFNPAMMKMNEQIGAKIYKTHITYRLIFDPNTEFKRYALLQREARKKKSTESELSANSAQS
jgi:hypothetical protein